MPSSKNFIITPIAPHNLNVRPLVVPENSIIRFRIENEEGDFLLSMDSHSRTIKPGEDFKLSKAEREFSIMSLSKGGFIDALKSKLFWGQDLRNV
jgi:NAD+ kinase